MPPDHVSSLVTNFLAEHGIDASDDAALYVVAQRVAAIPWGTGTTVEETLRLGGNGNCTGKHRVMLEALRQLGIEARPVVCTFHWQEQEIAYPEELRAFLADHHWPHSHVFIQVRGDDGRWIDLDVTWDPPLKLYGFWTFPEDWDGSHGFVGLKPVERFEGADIAAKQDELLNLLSPDQRKARDHFRGLFVAWVASLR